MLSPKEIVCVSRAAPWRSWIGLVPERNHPIQLGIFSIFIAVEKICSGEDVSRFLFGDLVRETKKTTIHKNGLLEDLGFCW